MQLDFLMLREIYEKKDTTQRSLSDAFFISLGKVNQVMKELKDKKYIEIIDSNLKGTNYQITKLGKKYLNEYKVDKCVIFACGQGVRLNPLTYDTHRSLLKVKDEVLIERLINQLHEKNIYDIVIMVGHLKEQFEYLIDKYNVKLVFNKEFNTKNTLATMYHARDYIKNKNCYIAVSDVYYEENLFHEYEIEPFYTGEYAHDLKNEWQIIYNKKNKILGIMEGGEDAYFMTGAAFFTKKFSEVFLKLASEYYFLDSTDNFYWEDVLIRNFDVLPDIFIHKVREGLIHEFDNINDYRDYNKTLNNTGSKAFMFVEKFFNINVDEMKDIECVKSGLTNKSYSFLLNDKKYVARVPGIGTYEYVNRKNEIETYKKIKKLNFSENVLYIDEDGYKISEYLYDTRYVDPKNDDDLKRLVKLYKKLHNSKIKVSFRNDPEFLIDKYMTLMKDRNVPPLYQDFDEAFKNEKKVEKFINKKKRDKVFTHGDTNIGNALLSNVDKKYDKLIDFEYAGMSDPLTDLALFSVYQKYTFDEAFNFLKIYEEKITESLKNIFVSYLALYGFYLAIWARVRDTEGNEDSGALGIESYHYFKEALKYLKERKII